LQEHLVDIGGCWSQIKWDEVAKILNKHFQGQTQKAGEMTAERRYDLKDKPKSKANEELKDTASFKSRKFAGEAKLTSQPLKKDRIAPERSSGSLRTQISNFTHSLAQQIVKQTKAEDRKANGGVADEDDPEAIEADGDDETDGEDEELEGQSEDLEDGV